MSATPWDKIEELTRLMAVLLLQRGAPQEACAYGAAVDQSCDLWLRAWIASPTAFELPTEPMLCRVLLARFRYATAFATMCKLAGKPLPRSSEAATLEVLLIDLWYHQDRSRWLSGERGTVPSEN